MDDSLTAALEQRDDLLNKIRRIECGAGRDFEKTATGRIDVTDEHLAKFRSRLAANEQLIATRKATGA